MAGKPRTLKLVQVQVVDPVGDVFARHWWSRLAVYAVDILGALTYGLFLLLYLLSVVGLPVAVGVLAVLIWLGAV